MAVTATSYVTEVNQLVQILVDQTDSIKGLDSNSTIALDKASDHCSIEYIQLDEKYTLGAQFALRVAITSFWSNPDLCGITKKQNGENGGNTVDPPIIRSKHNMCISAISHLLDRWLKINHKQAN